MRGQLALAHGDGNAALLFFKQALDVEPKPEAALTSAARLASSGHSVEALALLDHLTEVWRPDGAKGISMSSLHARLLFQQGYWRNEISHLRSTIQIDVSEIHSKAPMQTDISE